MGVVLVAVGTGMLAFAAWEFWGTNVVSNARHRSIVEALEDSWRSGAGPDEAPRSTTRPGSDPAERATAVVRIPRFGKDYAVPLIGGVDPDDLASGFGHFPGTADPGRPGNFALAGHRVTHGEPLRRMPELRPGDTVVIETATATYTYVLDTGGDALTVPFTATWVLAPMPHNPLGGVEPEQRAGQRLITLATCAALVATPNRMVAFGHLASSQPRDAAA